MYHFIHSDGRQGDGYSPWSAIANTVGRDEARRLPAVQDLQWDAEGKASVLLKEGGELIGHVYQCDGK